MPFCHTRVKAARASIIDPASYEALRFDENLKEWVWQREKVATTQGEELKLLLAGKMKREQAMFQLKDADSGKLVRMHNTSITWNAWRKKWVMIGLQSGDRD